MSKYKQDPKNTEINGKLYHLEDVLTHKQSGNKWQIKEIQNKGFISELIFSPVGMRKGTAYISYEMLEEYKL